MTFCGTWCCTRCIANHSLKRCTNHGSVIGTARGGLSRISASVSRSASCSSFVGRPRRLFELPLLEGAKDHERRGERRAGERVVQHKVFFRKRQDLVKPPPGIPQRIDEQTLAEIGHPGEQDGHFGGQQVTRHVGAVGSVQVSQSYRAFVVKIACGARAGQIMTADVAV